MLATSICDEAEGWEERKGGLPQSPSYPHGFFFFFRGEGSIVIYNIVLDPGVSSCA